MRLDAFLSRRAALLGGGLASLGMLLGIGLVATGGLSPTTPTEADAPPLFVEEAEAAGLVHRYDGEFEFFVGGGVAVFDCNGDGRQELYLAGGSEPAALYRNESTTGGQLRFAPMADPATDLTSVTGAYPLDVDGDGQTDLAVLRVGENVLLRGLGDCRFVRSNEDWGFDGGDAWSTAFSATWETSSAWPTMAIGNYRDQSSQDIDSLCFDNELFRPMDAARGFAQPTTLSPGWCALSMLFSDWDRSGRRDLRVSNDRQYYGLRGEEQLWRMAPGEQPRLYTRDEGWAKLQVWGMGVASQDLTRDGYPEIFLTSQGQNMLQTLADGPTQPAYTDIAIRRGVTAHRPFAGGDDLPSTAWHAEFQDVNNDGFMDLFIAKGNVEAQEGYATRDPSNLLLGQPDGTFLESAEAAGILSYARARGAALADLNLDGMLDMVVVNRRENVKLWRNVGFGDVDQPAPMGHWLAIELRQPAPNPGAIGSWVELKTGDRTVVREVTVGGGHAGGQLGWIHFGLGPAQRAELRVTWPDGEAGPWQPVGSDQFVIIERGAAEAQPWQPG